MNIDRAAVARHEEERATRATAERIAFLYGRLFQHIGSSRDLEHLRTEDQARKLFQSATNNLRQVEILRVAIDNRWTTVVNDFIKTWDEHPISDTVQELWDLTTGRVSA